MNGFGLFATVAFFTLLCAGLCFIALKSQEQAEKGEPARQPSNPTETGRK